MKNLLLLVVTGMVHLCVYAQTPPKELSWSEQDRSYLVENLTRSKNELLEETKDLTSAQWNFKESSDRWSINEIVEHIGIWELLFQREISQAIGAGVQPELKKNVQPDSVYLAFITEELRHITTDYTKPFTFSVPMGLSEGKVNTARFVKMRDEAVNYVRTTKDDLRGLFWMPGKPNVHQRFITTFGHTDRHLRQIRKVKLSKDYPK